MKRLINKKTVAVALSAGLVFGGGGVASAYFVSSGSGSGTATVGTVGGTDIAITSTGPTDSIYPGAPPVGFTVQAQNTGLGNEHVNDVTIAVAKDGSGNVLDAAGVPIAGCQASWFSVDTPLIVGTTLSPGASSSSVDSTIALNETGTNQDGCKGAVVKLIFELSNPA